MKLLIAGCGYVGTALGAELVKSGHEVWGLRRNIDMLHEIEKAGIKPVAADLLKPDKLRSLLPDFDTLVICQAPTHKNDEYKTTYFDATKNLLSVIPKYALRKIILISSTSVYGTREGGWVDETTDPMDGSFVDAESLENAKILLAQEQLVLTSGHPAIAFRLSGIYGPERNRVKSILQAKIKPTFSETYMNRIHLIDIIRGIKLLLDKGIPGEIYLGSDDEPTTQKQFYSWVYEKLSLKMPAANEEPDLLPHGSNKRISNKKIKELGLKLRFPSYREGYEQIIKTTLYQAKSQDGARLSSDWVS